MKRRVSPWPILIAAWCLAPAPVTAAPRRPNIVILLADDWGFTDVGSFGSEIRTPNIDALAARGVRFSNFHVAGSCSPTRAMLQTGVRNHRAGLGNMPETIPPEHVGKPGYDTVLNDRVVTIAQLLRDQGYRTYFTGKWHLGKTPTKLPHARGYDRAFALADAGADNFEQKPIIGMYDKADWTEDGRPATLPPDYYSSTFIVNKAVSYIDSGHGSGRPFFASINFLANHIPVQAPDAYLQRYRDTYRAGWDALRSARRARAVALGIISGDAAMVRMETSARWQPSIEASAAMTAYAAMAEAADHEIGRLVAHLKATGAYDHTVFVFLSDNGPEPLDPRTRLINRLFLSANYDFTPEHAGQRGTLTSIGPSWASAAAAPLRGYKFSAAEGGLRVPLVIAWPANRAIRGGRIAHGFTDVTDIAPTLLALAGVPLPGPRYRGRMIEPMTGRSLVPLLEGKAATIHPDDQPIGYELSGNAALFKGRYKLVKNLPPTGDGGWHLYDIVADPGETRDLTAADPARARTMRADYAAFAARDGVLPMPAGYTAAGQINANAFDTVARPKLERAAPFAALALLVLLAGALGWRLRRRRARRR
ncbi:sulfatase-like hydrolase/transferase [Sphingomonas sp. 37zxx]|uniref:sulfatase-like hydrolase/transferase n=1 Tax=Sphingomonas sp. 37zxx TaxID=1550073 RepID=UPI00053BF9FE|nr:sulfatase-like hydrolase/transferase [Sphingomonas sp. 37zxx]